MEELKFHTDPNWVKEILKGIDKGVSLGYHGLRKEATTAFKKHQASDCHREATEALVVLLKHIQGDVGELLSQQHQEEMATNRKMLIKIFENISFLARQGLPLRVIMGMAVTSSSCCIYVESIALR